MLTWIWAGILILAVLAGMLFDRMDAVSRASVDSAKSAVELAIGLVGAMTLWLGLMHVLHRGGFLKIVARALKPLTVRLLPDVPPEHPAISMMVMNITANMLGLANAATPFGLKAMIELERLNPRPGTATNAMALFLAINTANIALLPTGIISLRSSLDAEFPGSILLPSILATSVSTMVAIIVAKSLERFRFFEPSQSAEHEAMAHADEVHAAQAAQPDTQDAQASIDQDAPGASRAVRRAVSAVLVLLGVVICCGVAGTWTDLVIAGATPTAGVTDFFLTVFALISDLAKDWSLALLLLAIVLFGLRRGVDVYGAVVEGGKEGFQVALRIIPYLVAILVAVGMLRASGGLDLIVGLLEPVTRRIGMPAEALPMALLRTLSGTGAYGMAAEIMQVHGPDSFIGNLVSTLQGSTDTTFYVLALYFGAVGVRNIRHTLVACLAADTAGILAAVFVSRLFFLP